MRPWMLLPLILTYSIVKAWAQDDDAPRFYNDPWFYALTSSMAADLVTTKIVAMIVRR